MRKQEITLTGYPEFVAELKERIARAQGHAARAVNRELLLLYWDIGKGIVEKQKAFGWGDAIVETLAGDLRSVFPEVSGFSARNLWDMRRHYLACTDSAILRQLVAEFGNPKAMAAQRQAGVTGKRSPAQVKSAEFLRHHIATVPWGHHLLILNKIVTPAERFYYLRATVQLGWSRNVLLNQIKAKAYERSLREGKTHNFPAALPTHLAEQAEEVLKSSYNLEFLGIGQAGRERELELERRLLERVRDFILELGATRSASSETNIGSPSVARNILSICSSITDFLRHWWRSNSRLAPLRQSLPGRWIST